MFPTSNLKKCMFLFMALRGIDTFNKIMLHTTNNKTINKIVKNNYLIKIINIFNFIHKLIISNMFGVYNL